MLKLYFYYLLIMLFNKRNFTTAISYSKKRKYNDESEGTFGEDHMVDDDNYTEGDDSDDNYTEGDDSDDSDDSYTDSEGDGDGDSYDYDDSFINDDDSTCDGDGKGTCTKGTCSGSGSNVDKETILNKEFNTIYNKNALTNTSKNYFKSLDETNKVNIINKIKIIKGGDIDKPNIMKILDWDTTSNNKAFILNKLNIYENMENSNEFYKLNNWINQIFKVPFGYNVEPVITKNNTNKEISEYIKEVKNKFDEVIFGHEQSKDQLIKILAQTISNPSEGGNVFALQGPPGVGKTALIQEGIAKALNRPYAFISLGGTKGSSFLEGHEYTYEGSTNGRIIDALIETKCMNPIIYFDELDKVSESHEGRDIINVLMHITDTTQNKHFNDKYFGSIDFDISKCILIFSFNDESKICHILKDRMKIINVDSYKVNDKISIANKFIIPKLLKSINFDNTIKINFNDEVLKFIIETYTHEGGVRKFKEILNDILLEINVRRMRDYKNPLPDLNTLVNMDISQEMVEKDFLKKRHKVQTIYINDTPAVGCVNGLWANCEGVGGLIPIECNWKPSDEKFKLELTGMQGDVMKESMSIALTVATNILQSSTKNKLYKKLEKTFNKGIHIHCPDGSTPKDGPSAGCAITISLISLFTEVPVKNKIAMTGEINLKGHVTAIGGLEEKLEGAKKAGVELVLCPYENRDDYADIIEKNPLLINKNFSVHFINNIWEALELSLVSKINVNMF